ncbi:YlbF family regulator [Desulfosporosinus nitroreducens]|uniref:YlbF family regulator n=1 Tax=Desulfosporosinus nitroreducens TaxID=2018668 RepID=A0ABT8QJX4_9FIRM|nr:YlbF family regulator [Desulfosporosinus nitroreducens]MDO0821425.1 YlbF family regulator [Desulfosporosinus nitroreducens]
MDQLEDIIKKSTELGEAIAQTTVYRDFKKAEHDLLHNTEARKLVENLQKVKQEYHGRQMAGLELSKVEQEKLKEMETACVRNRQVLLSNEANSKFQEFMEQITANIKNGIKSIDT